MRTTYTVLVTIEHDAEQGHSTGRIAEIIQCALEEGTSCSVGFNAAQVDAFKGGHIVAQRMENFRDVERLNRILPLHWHSETE